jgi:hypothetical protein
LIRRACVIGRQGLPVLAGLLAGTGQAGAQLLYSCTLAASPAVPAGSTSAFAGTVTFSSTATAECRLLLNLLPTAANICIEAAKLPVSGSTDFLNGAAAVPYAVQVNGVTVGTTPVQVFSGMIPSTGFTFPVEYEVLSASYAGKLGGIYQATLSWTIYWPLGVCS